MAQLGNQNYNPYADLENPEIKDSLIQERGEQELQAREEKKYSEQFETEISPELNSITENFPKNLFSKNDFNELQSKIRGIYISENFRGESFNLESTLEKSIGSMAFEAAGAPGDYDNFIDYNKKQNDIRSQILDLINGDETYGDENGETHEAKTSKNISVENTQNNLPQSNEQLSETLPNRNLEEAPYYPILENFNRMLPEGEQLTKNDIAQIDSTYTPDGDFHANEFLENTLKNIDSLQFEGENSAKYLKNYIQKTLELNPKTSKKPEEGGEQKVEIPEDLQTVQLIKNNEDSPVVQLLAKNYTALPNETGSTNIEQNLQISIEVTANAIIEGKNFERTETFEYAMKDIHADNLELQLHALGYIFSLVNIAEGKKGKKSQNDIHTSKELQSRYETSKTEYIEAKITVLRKELEQADSVEDKKIIEEEIQKLEEVQAQGDVYTAGEDDVITSTND